MVRQNIYSGLSKNKNSWKMVCTNLKVTGEIICLYNTVIYPVLPLHENNEKRGVRSDRTLKMVLMEKSLPYVDL